MGAAHIIFLFRQIGYFYIEFFDPVQLLIGEVLNINQAVARPFMAGDQLIQFQLNGGGFLIRALLNDKYH